MDLPAVPFFLGRARDARWAMRQVRSSHRLLVAGVAGIGKTALLVEVARRLALEKRIRYLTLKGSTLSRGLAGLGLGGDLQKVHARLDEHALVLVVDDLHELHTAERERFFTALGGLRKGWCLVGSRERMATGDAKASLPSLELGPLDPDAAATLAGKLCQLHGRPRPTAQELELSDGHPRVIQLICSGDDPAHAVAEAASALTAGLPELAQRALDVLVHARIALLGQELAALLRADLREVTSAVLSLEARLLVAPWARLAGAYLPSEIARHLLTASRSVRDAPALHLGLARGFARLASRDRRDRIALRAEQAWHVAAAGNLRGAVRLVGRHGWEMLECDAGGVVSELLARAPRPRSEEHGLLLARSLYEQRTPESLARCELALAELAPGALKNPRFLLLSGRLQLMHGDLDGAVRSFELAARAARRGPLRVEARLLRIVALVDAGRESEGLGRELFALARRAMADRRPAPWLHAQLGVELLSRFRGVAAVAHLERAVDEGQRLGHCRIVDQAHVALAQALTFMGRLGEAQALLDCPPAACRWEGPASVGLARATVQAWLQYWRGDAVGAIRTASGLENRATALKDARSVLRAGILRSLALVEDGKPERALAALAAMPDENIPRPGGALEAWTRIVRAEAALRSGRPTSALRDLRAVVALRAGVNDVLRGLAEAVRAIAWIRAGAPLRARELALQRRTLKYDPSARWLRCRWELVEGEALLAQDEPADALEAAQRARASSSAGGAKLQAIQALDLAVRAALQSGDRPLARQFLGEKELLEHGGLPGAAARSLFYRAALVPRAQVVRALRKAYDAAEGQEARLCQAAAAMALVRLRDFSRAGCLGELPEPVCLEAANLADQVVPRVGKRSQGRDALLVLSRWYDIAIDAEEEVVLFGAAEQRSAKWRVMLKVLAALASEPGRAVSHEELAGRLWPGEAFHRLRHGNRLTGLIHHLRLRMGGLGPHLITQLEAYRLRSSVRCFMASEEFRRGVTSLDPFALRAAALRAVQPRLSVGVAARACRATAGGVRHVEKVLQDLAGAPPEAVAGGCS